MSANKTSFFPSLEEYITTIIRNFDHIPSERKAILERFSQYINTETKGGGSLKVNYICTHNSRRSHISQAWSYAAALFYNIPNTEHFSGGTEATALHPNAAAALERAGFKISKAEGNNNPHYLLRPGDDIASLELFSKIYDDAANPAKDFATVMTCSQADADCPFVPGANFRLLLPYEDPKTADGQPDQDQVYDERVRQIGTELFYAFSQAV